MFWSSFWLLFWTFNIFDKINLKLISQVQSPCVPASTEVELCVCESVCLCPCKCVYLCHSHSYYLTLPTLIIRQNINHHTLTNTDLNMEQSSFLIGCPLKQGGASERPPQLSWETILDGKQKLAKGEKKAPLMMLVLWSVSVLMRVLMSKTAWQWQHHGHLFLGHYLSQQPALHFRYSINNVFLDNGEETVCVCVSEGYMEGWLRNISYTYTYSCRNPISWSASNNAW